MDKEWQEIKKCFAAMSTAPDIAPQGCKTIGELSYRAAKYMKPRSDAASINKLAKRIAFIVFGEL